MKFGKYKDGGPYSTVTGWFLPEVKRLFSVVLLKFEGKSREAYHTHAFNSLFWVLKGKLTEHTLDGNLTEYRPRLLPRFLERDRFHKVDSDGTTWVLNLRGPWADYWFEYTAGCGLQKLTHGRKVIDTATPL